eukprot:scaffold578_cov167-Amphora_coffeaeformis.AAC.34
MYDEDKERVFDEPRTLTSNVIPVSHNITQFSCIRSHILLINGSLFRITLRNWACQRVASSSGRLRSGNTSGHEWGDRPSPMFCISVWMWMVLTAGRQERCP